MARGEKVPVGTESTNAEGYTYVKVNEKDWKLKHHIVAETKLGRALRPNERALFKDNNRQNFDADNILVVVKGASSRRKRIEFLLQKIDDLSEELKLLVAEEAAAQKSVKSAV